MDLEQKVNNLTHGFGILQNQNEELKIENQEIKAENEALREDVSQLQGTDMIRILECFEAHQQILYRKKDLLGVSDAPLSSCQEHYDQGNRKDGIYTIQVIQYRYFHHKAS